MSSIETQPIIFGNSELEEEEEKDREREYGTQKRLQSEHSPHFLLSLRSICQSLCAFQDREATEGEKKRKQLDPRTVPASSVISWSQLFLPGCPTSTRYRVRQSVR